ncbi:MAG: Hsp20/alpha crystallin family protein [Deltaproteobacteria bacterium]|nr:Hsp20/alpha crystallin family protein [Deltaproteobacteria bacterium]
MPGLIIWKTQEISKMKRDMERLVSRLREDLDISFFPGKMRTVPSVELLETENDLVLKAHLPNIDPENLHISITDNILNIKGEMKQKIVDDGKTQQSIQRLHSSFTRTLELPCKVMIDEIEATYKDGILQMVMPKCKPEMSRKIIINIK